MRYFIFIFCLFFVLANCNSTTNGENSGENTEQAEQRNNLKEKADSALVFCKRKGLNTDFCILIDMSIHSGRYRLFVWDFKKGSVIHKSLCCHGYGKKSTESKPVFSNVEGSYCTSLGRYKIGARSYSQWGINVHYKMHGYDKTNNNAFKRWVVLHSHTPVPSKEIYPSHLPLGWSQGCPVIDDASMTVLDKKFKKAAKPALLWIYN
ncbi:murein L,D-transpeptidase catalytic domain-containing protein [Dysgonomonas sp. 520]|uniref:murein L,D-transpeptidase catalytic domain-containing protein n=1 Tax=Dysgonomonas sp. 520 TaxID=2302931 RepID=UPI0013D019D2|nr:murein L,D-transpeptidase catalytic domain family protein [Dysgonomonas sp. 520]NDW09515.1 peptidase [Dysgonomonas sp. 520]